MAAISIQTASPFTVLNHTYGSVTTGDTVANDGRTALFFKNSNASARTLTLAANDADKPGFGTIAIPDTTITIPGSGTNGGECMVGFLPPERFNGAGGLVTLSIDNTTGLTVAAVRMGNYA